LHAGSGESGRYAPAGFCAGSRRCAIVITRRYAPMTVLDDILAGVAKDLERRQRDVPLDTLKTRSGRQDPALDPMPVFKSTGVSVIAEVKRHSPSGGDRKSVV